MIRQRMESGDGALGGRFVLACEIVGGQTALDLGMVQWAVPRDKLPAKVKKIVENSAGLSSAAIPAARKCIAAALDPNINGFEKEIEVSLDLV